MPATNRSSKKQSSSRAQKPSRNKRGNKRWVAGVKTVSTFPPEGLFTKDAHTIAKSRASKKVSPKGPGSGIRTLTYFINRAGRGLSRFGAKCWSGLSESSRSRGKDKRPTNAGERPDRRNNLYQALLSEVNPSSEIATPVFPPASRLPVRASQQGQFVARMTN
jgi:hypothetical protein